MGIRLQTDPLADTTVKILIEEKGLQGINFIFDQIMKNDELPNDMPETLRNYFEKSAEVPFEIDYEKVRRGERFFEAYGAQLSMMLLCKSLPATYACGRGAEVLYRTGRFMEGRNGSLKPFTKRLMDTSQFVIDVMTEGGLGKDGKGIRTAQKVRLMHASIRYYLKEKMNWEVDKYGEPINQEDMLGTLLAFSVFPVEGLEQMGVDISAQEKDDFLYAWQIIGHIMGVDPANIPTSFDEGAKVGHEILDSQKLPSEAGKELTKACIDFLEHVTPGTLFDFYPKYLVRYLIGDELADIVGVETDHKIIGSMLNRLAFAVLDISDDIKDNVPALRKISQEFNMALLNGMLGYFDDVKGSSFYIPPSLRKDWKIDTIPTWNSVINSPSISGWRISLQHKN